MRRQNHTNIGHTLLLDTILANRNHNVTSGRQILRRRREVELTLEGKESHIFQSIHITGIGLRQILVHDNNLFCRKISRIKKDHAITCLNVTVGRPHVVASATINGIIHIASIHE